MTELKLEFELENAELPIDYDKVILSFMKAAIENFSPDLFDSNEIGGDHATTNLKNI